MTSFPLVKRLAAVLTMAGCLFSCGPGSHAATLQSARSSGSFESHGKKILVDVYQPTTLGAYADVLVLHGAGGMLFDGPEMQRMARELAASGARAYVVHYFDGSGVPFTTHDAVLRAHHDEWLAAVRDAVSWVQHQQAQPSRPVAVYGYSMGAFLGIEASSDNAAVGALAEQAGGAWDGQMQRVGHMPPVLMIHGRADHRVPFEQYAVPLEQTLKQRGNTVETRFFDGEGHGFSAAAQVEARAAAIAFIQRNVARGIPAPRTGKPDRHRRRATIPKQQP